MPPGQYDAKIASAKIRDDGSLLITLGNVKRHIGAIEVGQVMHEVDTAEAERQFTKQMVETGRIPSAGMAAALNTRAQMAPSQGVSPGNTPMPAAPDRSNVQQSNNLLKQADEFKLRIRDAQSSLDKMDPRDGLYHQTLQDLVNCHSTYVELSVAIRDLLRV